MRIRLTLAGAALAAVTVVAGAPVAGAADDPKVPPKTNGQTVPKKDTAATGTQKDTAATDTQKDTAATDTKTNISDPSFAAVPAGNRELVGRIMTGLG
ncbi:hypothetical protein [Streptomyces rimosus]|uniref:hypothetical protein n=1 Tax=Streptomyces rimosus TaxID=1927 RepID=UPI0004C6B2CC|nr:hypothetical protein [Streptomyces rimosus]